MLGRKGRQADPRSKTFVAAKVLLKPLTHLGLGFAWGEHLACTEDTVGFESLELHQVLLVKAQLIAN